METSPKNTIDTEEGKEQAMADAKRLALEKVKQKATIVNIEDLAENEARKAADAYMTESAAKSKSNIFKKIWKHTFVDEYYRQREVGRVSKEIKDTGNIYSRRAGEDAILAHETAMKGISDRFTSEYEGTLSKGEDKKILDKEDPEAVQARTDIKNLLDNYAESKIDDEAFKNGKKTIIKGLKKENLLKGADNYADNLFEIAQNARLAIEHGAKMEELDYDLDIIIGKAKSSLKTEAHFNWVDKGIDKMKKSKVGRFVSPAVLSTAVGLAYSVATFTSKKMLSSKAAALISLGGSIAVSSAFAGMNESQRVALERKQHGIEMAEGGSFEPGDKRREQMEKYEYQMENSNDLLEKLHDLMFEKDKDGKDVVKDVRKEDLDAIFASLSDIEARNALNDKNKIDLISYSNLGNVEKERTELTILTARAKVELRKKMEGDFKDVLQGKNFDDYLAEKTQVVEDSLLGGEEGISAQDKAFRKYKAGRIAKKMIQTAIAGLVIGGTIQEIAAFGNDHVQGAVEGIFHHDVGATTQTPFEHLHNLISGHPSHMDMGNSVVSNIHDHNIEFPEGVHPISNPDGTIDILRGDHVISSHFLPQYDANGQFDAATIAKLGHDGIIASATHNMIDSTKEVTTTIDGYGLNHPGSTIHDHRDLWYGNNTPNYTDPDTGKILGSDLNELQTHWGGLNGTGLNENDDAVLNISHMAPGGSFQDGLSINAQEAMHKGALMAVITPDGAHQSLGIPVPIDANGNIVFDHNNPLMQQLFKPDASGHMTYHGKFIEIVEKMGADKNGIEHMRPLSTMVGEGLDKIKDTIPFHDDIVVNSISPSLDVENPLFVPLVARRPLEPVTFGGKEKKSGEDGKNKGIDGTVIPVDINDKEKDKVKGGSDTGMTFGPAGPRSGEQNKEEKTEELEITATEMEALLSKSKVISKEEKVGLPNEGKGITEGEISKRAYEIYEKRLKDGTEGNQESDWFKAEEQLKKELGDEESKEIKNNEVTMKKERPLSQIVEDEKYKWTGGKEFTEKEIELLIDNKYDGDSVRKLGPDVYGNYLNWIKENVKEKKSPDENSIKPNIENNENNENKKIKFEDFLKKGASFTGKGENKHYKIIKLSGGFLGWNKNKIKVEVKSTNNGYSYERTFSKEELKLSYDRSLEESRENIK